MSRPLRIEFPGAVYHVTSRGDRREPIFVDDEDRRGLLAVVDEALARFDAQMLAYCLMGNHYHFVLHTREANLSRLMRHVNGVYTQDKAILVDRDAYLLAVCRYVELNPVRAGMVAAPRDWPWSSYRAHVGRDEAPDWLDTDGLHGYLLGRGPEGPGDRRRAARRYEALVQAQQHEPLWEVALRGQIYLGDEGFVARMQALADPQRVRSVAIPRAHRRAIRPLAAWLATNEDRGEALRRAFREDGLTMTAMAAELGLSVSRVSRLIAAAERSVREAAVG